MCLANGNVCNVILFDVDWCWLVADVCWHGLHAGVAAPNVEIFSGSQRCKHISASSYLGDWSRGQVLEGSDEAGLVRRARWRYFPAEARGVPLIAQGVDIACIRESREAGLISHELPTRRERRETLALTLAQEPVERMVSADRASLIKNCLFVDVSFGGSSEMTRHQGFAYDGSV